MSVVVFGSINMDLVVRTPRFAQPGETLTGRTFYTAPGGKGANQAVAAARLGAPTWMVGRVGADVFGQALVSSLQASGVQTEVVFTDPSQPSGTALITVDDRAENQIIIIPGANGQMGEDDLERMHRVIGTRGVLLLQLETPLPGVLAAAQLARQHGLTVILDPAPAATLPDELYQAIDWITPNESEAALLVGFAVSDETSARQAAIVLHQRGVANVVIKMGGRGAFWSSPAGRLMLPPFHVQPVDTVAAGDAFNGALAAGLETGLAPAEALRRACAVGAISTTRPGAQPSMPTLSELEEFLTAHA
jgi:ribokinase